MSVTLFAAAFAQSMIVPPNAIDIPLEKFRTDNLAFNCSNNDFRTVGIFYNDDLRQLDFNHFENGKLVRSAILRNPVKWAKREVNDAGSNYYIHAEASQDNLPIKIDLIVNVPTKDSANATFWVNMDDYAMSGQNCALIPTRPMPLPGDRQ